MNRQKTEERKNNSRRIRSLINLLGDEDPRVSDAAMLELLRIGPRIASLVSRLQENPDNGLRKRAHQIQGVLRVRAKRAGLCRNMSSSKLHLFRSLIDLHCQCYETDSESEIYSNWAGLCHSASDFDTESLRGLGDFFRMMGFLSAGDEELDPNNYCVGVVLEDGRGAGSLLSAMARELGMACGLRTRIVFCGYGFGLVDSAGRILLPNRRWKVLSRRQRKKYRIWPDKDVLQLVASKLFLSAVAFENIRNIHTLGTILSRGSGSVPDKTLPAPYGETEK